MSAISDFNKVWVQKFPGSELPAAWEEDVKNNLSKHKQRVQELEDELEKEQVYVQFLESLLEEVEKLKSENSSGGPSRRRESNGSYRQERDITDVIKDTLERRVLAAQVRDTAIDASNEDISEGSEQLEDVRHSSKTESEHHEKGGNRSDPELSEDHQTEDDLDHFVTVIEINGVEKGKTASSHGESNQEDMNGRKKVPPRPPPKHFKQSISQDNEPMSSFGGLDKGKKGFAPVAKARADRPVVFDSKKPSAGNGTTSSQSSSTSSGSHPSSGVEQPCHPVPKVGSNNVNSGGTKRFEGYKLPLPQQPSRNEEKVADSKGYSQSPNHTHQSPPVERENPNVRSRILDLVNKMESSHKPMTPSKNIEQLTPKRSGSSSKNKNYFQSSAGAARHHADPVVSEYINPCDAELEEHIDQIYDSPPPEPEYLDDVQPVESRTDSRHNSLTDTKNSQPVGQEQPVELECEPMYDTVAPDQEDDYVLLLEDEKNQQAGSSGNSLTEKERPNARETAHTMSNNDLATIKSQSSVISGHSVTTTSSGTTSDAEFTGSPLPNEGKEGDFKHSANYVNIDYFLCKSKRKESMASGESEEDEPPLLRAISFDRDFEGGELREVENVDPNYENSEVFAAAANDTSSQGGQGPSTSGSQGRSARNETPTITAADQEKYALFRYMLSNIAESESAYVEVLNVMLQFMKALKATLATSKPVLSTDEFNIIFYKIPELFTLHQQFLQGLQQPTVQAGVGKCFENLAHEVGVYGAFLQNYSRAVDTVRKCSQNNADFAEITRNIRLRSLNKNQAVSLETLLYSPVSRVQKNVEIIQDLLKCLPSSHFDYFPLKSALKDFQSFVSEFKMIQPEQLFPGQDRNPRHLVKNSFIVELSEGHRKLRHIFLFNDVLVCAKYKASGKSEKFTFELKWYIPVSECLVIEESNEPRESNTINLVALRSQASTVRDQIKRQTSRDDSKKAKAEKQRKKLAELEAQLVLASPNLVFKVKAGSGRSYTFFLSSEYERSQWVDAIETLKTSQPSASTNLSMHELQNWLTSCRKHLKTNMGSYLLRTGRDENLLIGDFYVLIGQLKGIQRAADLYICLEVDSYGHFFRKAKTKMICESTQPSWNQDFTIELEGAQNLRVLLYEDHPKQGTLIRAKTTIELNRSWLTTTATEKKIELQDYVLTISTKFTPSEMTIRRVPTAKPSGLFGAKITQVCKREKRQVPFILTSCVREVERRGMNEVGIYRVSGSTSDVSRLKKAFETNSYEAEQLLKDVDIHSVTGTLKLYLRELPEALFTDDLYPKLFEAFNQQDQENKRKTLLHLFSTLPPINQHNIMFLLDHMVRVNKHENHNKMSLHNLATVFGPTLLRPGIKNEGIGGTDLLAAGTVDVMAQAGILYFFLTGRADSEHMQPV